MKKIRYAGPHVSRRKLPSNLPPEPPFSEFRPPPIRPPYVPRFPGFPERSPIRARIQIRRPPVWCESPGYFCYVESHQTWDTRRNLQVSSKRGGPDDRFTSDTTGIRRKIHPIRHVPGTSQNRGSFLFPVPQPRWEDVRPPKSACLDFFSSMEIRPFGVNPAYNGFLENVC